MNIAAKPLRHYWAPALLTKLKVGL